MIWRSDPSLSLRPDEDFCWRPSRSTWEAHLDSWEVQRLEGSDRDGGSERGEAPHLNRCKIF